MAYVFTVQGWAAVYRPCACTCALYFDYALSIGEGTCFRLGGTLNYFSLPRPLIIVMNMRLQQKKVIWKCKITIFRHLIWLSCDNHAPHLAI